MNAPGTGRRLAGEGLEQEVARIYRLLGATKTETRIVIGHYEVDVRAVVKNGPFEVSYIVECKEYGSDRVVSDPEMTHFAAKLAAARAADQADKGVFVTTASFSKYAIATAKQHGIQCITLRELHNQLVNFEPYLAWAVREFQASSLSRWYVDQTVSDFEDYDSLSPGDLKKVLHAPAVGHLDVLFGELGRKRVALLGNFGTGKSSLCQAYRATLARRALANSADRIPVLIDLRDFRSGLDIQQVIANALQRLPGVHTSMQVCLELQRMGRFLFLLDGLDEMATRVDRAVVNESLKEIDRLHSDGDNLYILTCRTHFFQEKILDEFSADYTVLYLTEWGYPELETYFNKRFGAEGPSRLAQLLAKPRIAELARTPLLLDILLETDDLQDPRLNVFGLLSRYTDGWITKQSKRRGAVMPSPQRRRFVLMLASHMYRQAVTRLHFSELYDVAKEFCGHRDAIGVDNFDADVRTCTFVTRDSAGNYSFCYETFFDYFVSASLAEDIEAGVASQLQSQELTPEIIDFVVGRGLHSMGLGHLHAWAGMLSEARLSTNCVRLLNALGQELAPDVRRHYEVSREERTAFDPVTSEESRKQWEELLVARLPQLQAFAKRIVGTYRSMDPDDLVNETVARLLSRRDTFGTRGHLNANSYIYAVMRNIARDHFRRAQQGVVVSSDLVDAYAKLLPGAYDPHSSPEEAERDHQVERIVKLMEQLPEPEREVLTRYIDGVALKEIAEEMGVNDRLVRIRIMSARRRLAQLVAWDR